VSEEQHRPGAKAPPPYGLSLWNPHAALLLSHRSGGHAPSSRLACDFQGLNDCSLPHGSISNLKPGDELVVEIEKIGRFQNPVVMELEL